MDLSVSKGSQFNAIYRCADMLCLDLGKTVRDGEGDDVSEYGFHVQTQWRFVKNGEIILLTMCRYLW